MTGENIRTNMNRYIVEILFQEDPFDKIPSVRTFGPYSLVEARKVFRSITKDLRKEAEDTPNRDHEEFEDNDIFGIASSYNGKHLSTTTVSLTVIEKYNPGSFTE